MKLLRAVCDCGFFTRKARSGYHFHRWWFPVIDHETGQLSDILRALPEEQVDEIQSSRVSKDKYHPSFLDASTRELQAEFATKTNVAFNPEPGSTFTCPQCRKPTLHLDQVYVTAMCMPKCGQQYQWHDTEKHGCPVCNYRPHHFRVDEESPFANQTEMSTMCRCFSELLSRSHVDAFCPKCGDLPDSYPLNGQYYCRIHQEPKQRYMRPKTIDIIFRLPESFGNNDQFRNAKLWGDDTSAEAEVGFYCPACEADHQKWLAQFRKK